MEFGIDLYILNYISAMNSKKISAITLPGLLSLTFTGFSQEVLPKPNIILVIADDVSWDDFGCYGNKQVKTPNIDHLASRGMRFNNFFLTASSSSPSRNSIITGRYPHNTGGSELHAEPPDYMLLPKRGYRLGISAALRIFSSQGSCQGTRYLRFSPVRPRHGGQPVEGRLGAVVLFGLP